MCFSLSLSLSLCVYGYISSIIISLSPAPPLSLFLCHPTPTHAFYYFFFSPKLASALCLCLSFCLSLYPLIRKGSTCQPEDKFDGDKPYAWWALSLSSNECIPFFMPSLQCLPNSVAHETPQPRKNSDGQERMSQFLSLLQFPVILTCRQAM